jgi:hypothetical protein
VIRVLDLLCRGYLQSGSSWDHRNVSEWEGLGTGVGKYPSEKEGVVLQSNLNMQRQSRAGNNNDRKDLSLMQCLLISMIVLMVVRQIDHIKMISV